MGTAGLTCIVDHNQFKVAQYGKWDHYPSGQGLNALTILHWLDIDEFKQKIDKVNVINDWHLGFILKPFDSRPEERKATEPNRLTSEDDQKFADMCPEFDNTTGAEIIELIDKSNGKIAVRDDTDFAADSLMCEWLWLVDLDQNTFEAYTGFNTEPLTEKDRFYFLQERAIQINKRNLRMGIRNNYYPVKHHTSFDLLNLPSGKEFLSRFDED